MKPRLIPATALLVGGALVSASAMAQSDDATSEANIASASLATSSGEPAGYVDFTQTPDGVVIEVFLSNVSPGMHGIHLHDTGECSGDFSSAGSHIGADTGEHGFHSEDGPHAGDLPNINVAVDGAGSAVFYNNRVSLSDDDTTLLDGNGSAVIVHEFGDTYNAQSDTGTRIACGVIEGNT